MKTVSPGAKGWINKYFDLVENNDIEISVVRPRGLRKLHFMHLTLGSSGILFGHALDLIFARELDKAHWTNEEKLKVLLFESHLFIYQMVHADETFDRNQFLNEIHEFYSYHNAKSVRDYLPKIRKKGVIEQLEDILAKRIDIKLNLIENKWWVNSLSNGFVFLDVILFDDYLHKDFKSSLKNYESFALNALTAITLSAYADGVIEAKEKDMFNVFLASSGVDSEKRDRAKERFKRGVSLDDFSGYVKDHWMLKHFLLDISALMIYSNHKALPEEIDFLKALASNFNCGEKRLNEVLAIVENFVYKTKEEAMILKDASSYEKVYISFTQRWTKVLMRNKEKVSVEIGESKELIALIRKSTKEDLSEDEKKMVREQLKDLAKTVPAFTVFMMPGGTILLPVLMKMLPNLVPSAFRENQIETEGDTDASSKREDESIG